MYRLCQVVKDQISEYRESNWRQKSGNSWRNWYEIDNGI